MTSVLTLCHRTLMLDRFARALRLHRFLVAFSVAYTLGLVAVTLLLHGDLKVMLRFVDETTLGFVASGMFFMFVMLYFLVQAVKKTEEGPKEFERVMKAWEDSTIAWLKSDQFANAVLAVLIASPMTVFFCIGKGFIPNLHYYALDPVLAAWDRALHFGHYPHEFFLPLVQKFDLAHTIDAFYVTWFPVLYAVSQFVFVAEWDQYRRMRFLWTFCLTWLVAGNILAIALSSVGPLLFHDFYPALADPYAALTAYLHAQNAEHKMILFKIVQGVDELTRNHDIVKLNAFSAMPSMHIAMTVLFFLYARTVKPALAWLFFLPYALLITASSVCLGWHYAVDGYAAALVTGLLWWFSGWLVHRLHPELAAQPG
jgi:hypothetical protein